MEPSINSGLEENLDLSPLLMKDIGWNTRDIAIPHLTYELWLNDYGLALTDLKLPLPMTSTMMASPIFLNTFKISSLFKPAPAASLWTTRP
jgi:hypothetical protein